MSSKRHRKGRSRPRAATAGSSARAASAPSSKPFPKTALAGALLVVATFAVFAPVLRNGFVSYDDEEYVLRNSHVRTGLTGANLTWAITATDAANWHPVTWISHMADVSLFGLAPAGHHFTSLLFHCASVLLVFLLLRRATGAMGRSAAVAALFALHPLRVESVAWIAERKDVLSAFFGLLAIGAWARWTRERRGGLYAASLGLYALSLMSKPTLVTLPLLLLVLDFWPLERLASGPAPDRRARLRSLLLEKVPYLALAAVGAALAYRAQRGGGATGALDVPLGLRLENAVVAPIRYVGKLLWPAKLAALYPHPGAALGWKAWVSAAVLIAATVLVLRARRRKPYLCAGWIWYLAALLPVLGIVQVGWQAFADRYTYMPSLGLAAAAVWGVASAAEGRISPRALAAATAAVLAALSFLTVRQLSTWRDSLALYTHALEATGPNETMEIDLGNELARRGRTEEAARHFEAALRAAPGSADALYALGGLALSENRYAEARAKFEEAARRHPDFAPAHVQTAVSLIREGRPSDAIPHVERALAIRAGSPEALYVFGSALDAQGKAAEAEAKYEAALKARPDYPEAHVNLGDLLLARGRPREAIPHFEAALRSNPEFSEARQGLEEAKKRAGG
jgi:tetratricopeptide (TPR) repeat protein